MSILHLPSAHTYVVELMLSMSSLCLRQADPFKCPSPVLKTCLACNCSAPCADVAAGLGDTPVFSVIVLHSVRVTGSKHIAALTVLSSTSSQSVTSKALLMFPC